MGGGSKKLASLYINNNGTSKKLNYAYANINGSKKEIYSSITKVTSISSLKKDDIIYFNDGISTMSEYVVVDINTYTGSNSEYSTIILNRTHCLPNYINDSAFNKKMKETNTTSTYSGLQYDLIETPLKNTNPSYKYVNSIGGKYLYFHYAGYKVEDELDEDGAFIGYGSASSFSEDYTGHGSGATVRGLGEMCWTRTSNGSENVYGYFSSSLSNFLNKFPSILDNGTEVWEYTGQLLEPHWHSDSANYDPPKYEIKLKKGSSQTRYFNDCSSDFNSIHIYMRPLIVIYQDSLTEVYKK